MFPQFFSVYSTFRLKCCYNTFRTRDNSTAHGREASQRELLSERILLVTYNTMSDIVFIIYVILTLFCLILCINNS